MDHAIICFACRRRLTPEELTAGQHNHLDEKEARARKLKDYGATQV